MSRVVESLSGSRCIFKILGISWGPEIKKLKVWASSSSVGCMRPIWSVNWLAVF